LRAALFKILDIGLAIHPPRPLLSPADVDIPNRAIIGVARQSLDRDVELARRHLWSQKRLAHDTASPIWAAAVNPAFIAAAIAAAFSGVSASASVKLLRSLSTATIADGGISPK
jgi:hypothetical protein